ncbi:MAG: OsmC family protein [Rhodospirillaceae bacterium]
MDPPKEDSPRLRTIETTGKRNGAFRTDVGVRDFEFVIDEPEKLGGTDRAPTPMEYVTGALGGCFNVTIEMVAGEQNFRLDDIAVKCVGVVDHRGLFGTADVSPHFQSVAVDIDISSPEPEARRAALETVCLARCPVYNLIKDSGAAIAVNWRYR